MSKFKEFVLIIFGIFILLILIYNLAYFNKGITGRVSFELDPIYKEGQTLGGILKIFLKEGELIPSDSKIVFEIAGKSYEYNLNEVISEELTSGNFYIEEANLSGNGEGFGVKGKKTIYPIVYFKLNISSVSSNETESLSMSEEIISGEVFANNDFSHDLGTGQTTEIVSGSVRIDSGNLNDSEINLNIEENKVIVSTNYSETKEGFGENYLGERVKVLSINLSDLDFKGETGKLKVSLIHDNKEIISFTTALSVGITLPNIITKEKNETINESSNVLKGNITQEANESIKETLTTELGIALSNEEKNILVKEFGNQYVKITNAEKTSEDIIVRFEIENYWVEHHYDSLNSNESLKLKVEKDRIRFLKDLANKFSEEEITG